MEFHAKYIDEYNPAKLFHWYPRQQKPQEVMISVDIRDGEVSARYNPEIGNAISKAEFEGEWLMFPLKDCPTALSVNRLIDDCVMFLNDQLRANDWGLGNFQPHSESVQELIEGLRMITDNASFYSIHHVNMDRNDELGIWDKDGEFVDLVNP
jgi:hypothetical protein